MQLLIEAIGGRVADKTIVVKAGAAEQRVADLLAVIDQRGAHRRVEVAGQRVIGGQRIGHIQSDEQIVEGVGDAQRIDGVADRLLVGGSVKIAETGAVGDEVEDDPVGAGKIVIAELRRQEGVVEGHRIEGGAAEIVRSQDDVVMNRAPKTTAIPIDVWLTKLLHSGRPDQT